MTVSAELRRSPLHDLHAQMDAKFIDFYGWQLPVATDVVRLVLQSNGGSTSTCRINDGALVSTTIPFPYPVTVELVATLPAEFLYVDVVQ